MLTRQQYLQYAKQLQELRKDLTEGYSTVQELMQAPERKAYRLAVELENELDKITAPWD